MTAIRGSNSSATLVNPEKTSERSFEFEILYVVDPKSPFEIDHESFLLQINLATGDIYELTVWTHAYLARLYQQDRESGNRLGGQYLIPPDLLIASLDEAVLEATIVELIQTQALREEWLIPDEFTANWVESLESSDDEDDADTEQMDMLLPESDHDICGCYYLHRAE